MNTLLAIATPYANAPRPFGHGLRACATLPRNRKEDALHHD
jgi:hypothetical protein